MRTTGLAAALAAAVFVPGLSISVAAHDHQTFTVNCSRGQTIAKALELGDSRKPLVLIIRGMCKENVVITRDRVTLQGDPPRAATVQAVNPKAHAIEIRATWVTIDGLSVTGGLNGIMATGVSVLSVTNSVIQNAAQSGINLGASFGWLEGNTIQNSGSNGLTLSAAQAYVGTSEITKNAGSGIRLNSSSTLSVSGTTLSGNGESGVYVSRSGADINGTTITDNGFHGVYLAGGSASIGGSSLAKNSGCGIYGDFATVNVTGGTVNNNSACGVSVYLGSIVTAIRAAIGFNAGNGLAVRANSTAHIDGVTIRSNTGDGIYLQYGSKLITQPPRSNDLTENGGWGLQCTDQESSVESTALLVGTINPSCTGF